MRWSLAELPVISPTQLRETPHQGYRPNDKKPVKVNGNVTKGSLPLDSCVQSRTAIVFMRFSITSHFLSQNPTLQ